jgi:hypothetical protein
MTTPGSKNPDGTTTQDVVTHSTTTWATIHDAVISNRPIGKSTAKSTTYSAATQYNPYCNVDFLDANDFDDTGRQLSDTATVSAPACASDIKYSPWTYRFDSWDWLGRNKTATYTDALGFCTNGVWTAIYDDGARTVTNKGGGCAERQSTTTYSADGIATATLSFYDGTEEIDTMTYSAFEEICEDWRSDRQVTIPL